MHRRLGNLFIVIIVVAIAILLFSGEIRRRNDSTVNGWKECVTASWSIGYPPEWDVLPASGGDRGPISCEPSREQDIVFGFSPNSIQVMGVTRDLRDAPPIPEAPNPWRSIHSVDDYLKRHLRERVLGKDGETVESGKCVLEKEYLVAQERMAILGAGDSPTSFCFPWNRQAAVFHNDVLYVIGSGDEVSKELFYRVIETFRFND